MLITLLCLRTIIREWTLITGGGGGGGHMKFYPSEKGADRKSFSHAEGGGGTTSFGVVFDAVGLHAYSPEGM